MSDHITLFLMGLSFWMFAYFIYLKLTQLLLSRMELHDPTRTHLIEGFWYTSFFVSSVVYCTLTLILDHKINSVNSVYELMTENIFEPHRMFTKCTLNYLPIICSFYAHIVLVSLSKEGFNKDNLARLLFLLFIMSAILLRCHKAVHVGLLLFNSSAMFSGICGILCAFNRSPERRLQLSYILLWLCFILHCTSWLLVFLFLVPVILLLPAFTVKVQSSDLFILLLLNLTLWIFFCVQLGNSPLFRFIQVICRKEQVSAKNRSIIDYTMFPSHFLRTSELLKLREEFALYRRKWSSLKSSNSLRNTIDSSNASSQNNKAKLFQTVKCVMALKRRIKRRREQKECNALLSEGSTLALQDTMSDESCSSSLEVLESQ